MASVRQTIVIAIAVDSEKTSEGMKRKQISLLISSAFNVMTIDVLYNLILFTHLRFKY